MGGFALFDIVVKYRNKHMTIGNIQLILLYEERRVRAGYLGGFALAFRQEGGRQPELSRNVHYKAHTFVYCTVYTISAV